MVQRSRFLCAPRRHRGATLLIVIFLVAIATLSVLISRLSLISQRAAQLGVAAGAQNEAKNALLGYLRTNGNPEFWGLLPLPDMGKRDATAHVEGESAANFSADAARALLANNNDALLIGRLPSKTLGLPALRDNASHCLWYAVSAAFKATNYGPGYVPSFNWDTLGDFETGRSDDPHESRAVALIFGPGAPTSGQARVALPPAMGETVSECGGNYLVGNYLEALEINPANPTTDGNQAVYVLPPAERSPATPPGPAITTTLHSGTVATNDQVLAITSSEIFQQIASTGKLQASLNNTVLPLLKTCLEAKNLPTTGLALLSSVPPGQRRYTGPLAPAGTAAGQIDCPAISGSNAKELARWRDNIWYLTCDAPLSGCLQLSDTTGFNPPQSCDGLIVFAGSRVTKSATRAAQRRSTAAEKTNPEQYFETDPANPNSPDVVNAFLPTTVSAVKARSALSSNPDELSQDVALCLKRPAPPVTPTVQIDTFVDVTPVVGGEPLVSRDTAADVITLGNFAVSSGSLGGASAVGATFSGPLIGTVAAATTTTVALPASARAENDVYKGFPIEITGGPGAGQQRLISAYDGATRTATVAAAWSEMPDATSTFKIDVGMLPFGSGIRVYFRAKILQNGSTYTAGPGFVFALFDADRNVDADGIPTARVSGGSGPNGQYLGYAGRNLDGLGGLIAPPIEYPKIGLEFDTIESSGTGGTNDTTNAHLALVYWGYSHDSPALLSSLYDDDNTHRIPVQPQTGYLDPYAASAFGYPALRDAFEGNRDFHVRFEIDRQYAAASGVGRYVSRLWIVRAVDGMIAGMDNVEQDFTTISSIAPQHTQTVNMTDPIAGNEGFRRFRFGFTNAQSTRAQEVTIRDLKLRLR